MSSNHVSTAGKQSDDGRSLVVKTNKDYRKTPKDFSIITDRIEESENTKLDIICSIRYSSQFIKSVDEVRSDKKCVNGFSYSMDSSQSSKIPKDMTRIRVSKIVTRQKSVNVEVSEPPDISQSADQRIISTCEQDSDDIDSPEELGTIRCIRESKKCIVEDLSMVDRVRESQVDNSLRIAKDLRARDEEWLATMFENNQRQWSALEPINQRSRIELETEDSVIRCQTDPKNKIIECQGDEVYQHHNCPSGEDNPMYRSKDAASNKMVEDSDIRNAVELPDDMENDLGEERIASFSMEQLSRAGEAEALQKPMNHLSDQQLARFLTSASAINYPIIVQDLQTLRAVKVPFMQCLGRLQKFSRDISAANEFADLTILRENLQSAILSTVRQSKACMDDHNSNCRIVETKFAEHYHKAFNEITCADQGRQKTIKSIAVDIGRSTNACLQLLRGGVQSAINLVIGSIQNAASRKGAAIILILDRRQLLISRGVHSIVKFVLEFYWNHEELRSAVAILQDCR